MAEVTVRVGADQSSTTEIGSVQADPATLLTNTGRNCANSNSNSISAESEQSSRTSAEIEPHAAADNMGSSNLATMTSNMGGNTDSHLLHESQNKTRLAIAAMHLAVVSMIFQILSSTDCQHESAFCIPILCGSSVVVTFSLLIAIDTLHPLLVDILPPSLRTSIYVVQFCLYIIFNIFFTSLSNHRVFLTCLIYLLSALSIIVHVTISKIQHGRQYRLTIASRISKRLPA